jgi:hypothetical protein
MKLSDLPQHHAVLVVTGEREKTALNLFEELRALSPAHRFFNQTVLDIETSRTIISWANTPYNEEKIGLISFHTSGIPAQNAMLKILEEPREGVRFILVTSNKETLLPTVLSRLQPVEMDDASKKDLDEAQLFLATKPTSRIKLPFVVELLSREDEEGRKDRESVRRFILEIGDALRNSSHKDAHPFFEIFEMASYASDPSASGKAILEYLSLSLPQLKN